MPPDEQLIDQVVSHKSRGPGHQRFHATRLRGR